MLDPPKEEESMSIKCIKKFHEESLQGPWGYLGTNKDGGWFGKALAGRGVA